MKQDITCVILAAGKGTRLKLSTPKALLTVCGSKMVDYAVNTCSEFVNKCDLSGVVSIIVGHKKESVIEHIKLYGNDQLEFIHQEQQNGTGHAVKEFCSQTKSESDYVLIMCVDTPLVDSKIVESFYHNFKQSQADASVATFVASSPTGYGRIVKQESCRGFRIVEEQDADNEIKKITKVNSGLYLFRRDYLKNKIEALNTNNASGELYLTDLFTDDSNVKSFSVENGETIFMGVNDLKQAEEIELKIRESKVNELRENGVRFIDSSSVYIDRAVELGPASVVYPNVMITGDSKIGENVVIGMGCIIDDANIESGVILKPYTVIEGSTISKDCQVGPFARVRPGSMIGEASKIGNFVETKKCVLEKGVKVSHLSYVGDASVGKNSNIGCGFITCNYDGEKKHKTEIGEGCFIGSDSQMIAPVKLGDRCYVASGSTINKDMPDDSFAISRGRQETKEGLAKKFIK